MAPPSTLEFTVKGPEVGNLAAIARPISAFVHAGTVADASSDSIQQRLWKCPPAKYRNLALSREIRQRLL
jgi:hypothetical protein